MRVIKGDLVKLAASGDFNIIVHGCNCFNTMGAGVALQIAKRFPEAARVDSFTNYGDKRKLGNTSIATTRGDAGDALIIVNAYTQYGTATSPGDCVVDYNAVYAAFAYTVYNLACIAPNMRIGIPMIGSGLAGGEWDIISQLIEDAMDYDGFNDPNLLTLVEYDG